MHPATTSKKFYTQDLTLPIAKLVPKKLRRLCEGLRYPHTFAIHSLPGAGAHGYRYRPVFSSKVAGTNTLQMRATSLHSKGKDLRSARRPAMTASCYYSARRVSPHRRVVNLVRSGRKQPQLLYVSAGGKARHLSFWRPSRLRVPPPRFHPKQLSLVYLADVGVWCM